MIEETFFVPTNQWRIKQKKFLVSNTEYFWRGRQFTVFFKYLVTKYKHKIL